MGWWWEAHLSTFPRHLTKIKVLLKNKWGGRACISERLVYFYKSGQTSRIYCDRSKTWGESRDSPWRVLKIKKIKKMKVCSVTGLFFLFSSKREQKVFPLWPNSKCRDTMVGAVVALLTLTLNTMCSVTWKVYWNLSDQKSGQSAAFFA